MLIYKYKTYETQTDYSYRRIVHILHTYIIIITIIHDKVRELLSKIIKENI